MKYKVNDKVVVQSEDWYYDNEFIDVVDIGPGFVEEMTYRCSSVVTISEVRESYYLIVEDGHEFKWCDEFFIGKKINKSIFNPKLI